MADENVTENDETQTEAQTEAQTEPEVVEEPAAEVPEEAPEAEASDAPEAEAAEAPEAEAPAEEPVAEASAGEAQAEEAADEPQPEAEAPAAEAADEAPADADEAEAPAEAPGKRKKKRLPRSLRSAKTRRRHVPATERKPITRLPKPEHERGRRQERQGKVVSAGADKTIVVRVEVAKAHPRYKKVIRRSTKLHAHDEQNQAKVGDIVRIVETRPLSRLKRWRLQEIVEVAK